MTTTPDFRIRQVPPEATRPLRQRLLRQSDTLDQLALSDGDDPHAGYFVALAPDGRVVATASARPEAPTWAPDTPDAWRIRGVVTDEPFRRRGLGLGVLRAAMDHAARHGARYLWCHVRTPAIPFYEHAGFRTRGAPWDDPETGPHVAVEQRLHP